MSQHCHNHADSFPIAECICSQREINGHCGKGGRGTGVGGSGGGGINGLFYRGRMRLSIASVSIDLADY